MAYCDLLKCDDTVLFTTRKAGECQGGTIAYDAAFDWYVTCTLIDCFRHQDWVLVLSPSVDMVDVVGTIVGVVYPLPAEGQLILITIFRSLFLNSG